MAADEPHRPDPLPDFLGRELLGDVARVFDAISAEYGWSDRRILELPLRRVRQIHAAIVERRWLADLQRRRLEAAKLRILCSYVAATIPVGKGEENTLITSAASITLGEGTEEPDLPGQTGDEADTDADGTPINSFEGFMAAFGRALG